MRVTTVRTIIHWVIVWSSMYALWMFCNYGFPDDRIILGLVMANFGYAIGSTYETRKKWIETGRFN